MRHIAKNHGATLARGTILLFIDADCRIGPTLLENSLKDIQKRNIDVAGYYIKTMGTDFFDRLYWKICNSIIYPVMQYTNNPFCSGGCGTIVKKEIHDRIGGFVENQLFEHAGSDAVLSFHAAQPFYSG